KHDMNSIKGLLQRVIQGQSLEVELPFSGAEEVETYSLDDVEREQIRRALANFNGNRRKAANALGIGERTLYRKIKQYRIKDD
ncbi:MAG TPA: sigma-54-dependent Fis family transcriptional regulator, partial [Bacteroidetes bacterium]|nr:sigma-54-dependent Fis family transcriptional regulator [Bacteroidota bacterium]